MNTAFNIICSCMCKKIIALQNLNLQVFYISFISFLLIIIQYTHSLNAQCKASYNMHTVTVPIVGQTDIRHYLNFIFKCSTIGTNTVIHDMRYVSESYQFIISDNSSNDEKLNAINSYNLCLHASFSTFMQNRYRGMIKVVIFSHIGVVYC